MSDATGFVNAALKPPPDLVINEGNLPATVDALRDLIAVSGAFYDRDGPSQVVTDQNGAPAIVKLTKNNIVYIAHRLCRPVKLVATDKKITKKPVTLPERVAQMYLDLRGEWKLPGLSGVSTAPLLTGDGSIRSARGYDEATKLWCHNVPDLAVPEQPTRQQAEAALRAIRDTFRTFPFADAETKYDRKLGVNVIDPGQPIGLDESAFLNGLLTAACRQSLWLAPGLLINAPSYSGAGTGKGLLLRAINMTAYGISCRPFSPGNDKHEMDKRIVAELIEGRPSLTMDNVNGEVLRSNTLCSIMTERPAGVRILGQSRMAHLDQAAFVAVTGNGLTVSEDLGRRFIVLEFDARCENPEFRPFAAGFLEIIASERTKLLAAALTIWRWGRRRKADEADNADGFVACGQTLGSFEQWGEWIRDPLLALGCRDPVERIREIKERDPNRVQIIEVFTAWWAKHGDRTMRVAELDPAVLQVLDPKDTSRQYQARAVSNLAGTRLAGYALERVGAVPNKHKGGAQYRLHYNPPQGEDPETHPRHPQNPAEAAEKAEETTTNDVRMTLRMTAGAQGHPQVIRNQANGQEASEINDLADGAAGDADDADGFRDHSARPLTDVEAAYEELASREVPAVDDDDPRHLTISTKSDLQVIADELWLRAGSSPKGNGGVTLGSSK
jgi:hypothetical protein